MLNLIDKALLPFDPQRVAARVKARAQVSALDTMASTGSPGPGGGSSGSGAGSRWWNPFARSAARDTLPQLGSQRGASRELARTNPIAAGAINTSVDRIIGTGLAFVATPARQVLGWSADQAEEWKATTQAEFSMWADDPQACDLTGEETFYQAQATAVRGTKESGDIFTLLPNAERTRMQPYALRFQLIEADRVGNPNGVMDSDEIAGGIKFGPGGRPIAAHIYDRHPGAGYTGKATNLYAGEWVNFQGATGRLRLLHHYKKRRPGQPRGVPYLAPVVDLIKQIGRFTDAEVEAAVINSFFTMIVETENGNASPVFGATNSTATGAGPQPADDIALGPAAVVGLAKGESATFADPKRPNVNAVEFIHGLIGLIGMGLGIPREVLLKQFNSSYSASKAALLDAWVHFRSERAWAAISFCQPIVETWLAEAVFLGRVKAPGFFSDPLLRWAYTRAAWPGDSMGSINPKDEVAAYTSAIDARLMTRERAEWELGGTDWNATFDQKWAEHQRLAKAGLLPVPKAGAAAAPQGQPASAPTEPEDTNDDPA